MKLTSRRADRSILCVCSVVLATALAGARNEVQAGGATAVPHEYKRISEIRAERKRAAAEGDLPLPGTPDLSQLDKRLAEKGVPADASIMIRIFKAESELEVWFSTDDGSGRYQRFAAYPICFWSGTLGPKLKEGDRQAPEGFYTVALPQAHPGGKRWPQAIDIGYPNPFDQVHERTGGAILIHGGCSSIGCFAMTNAVADEVRDLSVRSLDAGQPYVPIHVFPFRMTEANMARYENPQWSAFWRNLKKGYDIFEETRRPPRVAACGDHYDFKETDAYGSVNPGPLVVCPRETTAGIETSSTQKLAHYHQRGSSRQ